MLPAKQAPIVPPAQQGQADAAQRMLARGFKLVPCRLTLPDGRRVFGCKWVKEG